MRPAHLWYEPIDEHSASVTLDGDIEAPTAAALEQAVLAATRNGKDCFLVDLAAVGVADASLVESLFHVGRLVENLHGKVVLVSTPGSRLRDVLRSAGLQKRMRMAATRSEALTAARE
ncbi:MAG TPA: STAS domain-containing protein [Thermoleophilaceae bacterium]